MKRMFPIQKLFTAASVLFILLGSIPLYFILYTLGELNWANIPTILNYYSIPFARTILLSSVTSLFVLFFSGIAVLVTLRVPRTYRKITAFLLSIPIIFPPYIAAISYIDIFKSAWGLSLFGRSSVIEFIQAAFVLGLFLYPYSFLLIKNRMEMIDPAHRKIVSMYPWSLFKKIRLLYVPHLKGVLVSAMMLPFLYVVADFGAVSILRMDTLTTELYQSMIRKFEYGEGALLSLMLLFIVSIVLIIGTRVAVNPVTSMRKNDSEDQWFSLSLVEKILTLASIIILIVLSVVVPLLKIIQWFLQFLQEKSVLKDIWFDSNVFLNSIVITIVISLIVVSVTQIMAFSVQILELFSKKGIITKIVNHQTVVLHALPAIVIVFSVLIFKYTSPFINSNAFFFLFFAYFLRYLGVAFLSISPAIKIIPEAYLRIGSTFIPRISERVKMIVLPYTKKYLFQSGNYIYFLSLRELTIPLILLPLGVNVLSVQIWQTASEGLYIYASPAILVLLLLSLPSLIWYIREQV